MASDLLHIKDGYFFEFPKVLLKSNRKSADQFPAWFVRNDADYQSFEADQIVERLGELGVDPVALSTLKSDWLAWQKESPANYAWPLDSYLEKQYTAVEQQASEWAKEFAPEAADGLKAYLAANPTPQVRWFHELLDSPKSAQQWQLLKQEVNGGPFLDRYLREHGESWGSEKIAEYNESLDGKWLISQPFGTPRNAYEAESGFCISRYMIIEIVVAILLLVIFGWLARRLATGESPKGKAWNLLEGMTQGVRSQIVVPAMGEHDADRFMPFFYTLFYFILGCNLMGMLPFVGAPTAAFGTTLALAVVVFVLGMTLGIRKFGVLGYLKNVCPDLGLPWYLAIVLVPILWVIEAVSLLIKHVVLSVRLLLNMSAGHLVMLGILGIGISVEAAQMGVGGWSAVALVSILGTTLLSFLELFVAFLQAFVFTFLAAMLVGSSIHHH